MKVLVTGGMGFIGSNLVDSLLSQGHDVRVVDNGSTGHPEFLTEAHVSKQFEFVSGDLSDPLIALSAVLGMDAVVHLAANADVRFGWSHPRRDFEQNVVVTQNVLEAMRQHQVGRLIFSSTGSVYGEATEIPTPESAKFPIQTSLYGASKSAAEGMIAAYAAAGLVEASVFRFVSILGPRYTHGHVIDFVAQLVVEPNRLRVLGNGLQKKSYLHVSDCVRAITMRLSEHPSYEAINLGTDSYCTVNDSLSWITNRLNVSPEINYSGGERGWVGDNPFIFLDTQKIRELGWVPQHGIQKSVEDTVDWILDNKWVLSSAVA